MIQTTRIAELIDHLPEDDQEKVEEYILYLQSKSYIIPALETEEDIAYREYILEGIRRGEQDIANGRVYDVDEGRHRLLEMLGE